MVSATDLKAYKSASSGLGGAINTSDQIQSASPNNLFDNVPNNERVLGEDYYRCLYFKNTHGSESMEEFTLWLDQESPLSDTEIKWGFDSSSSAGSGYRWSPPFTSNGSNNDTTADSASLDLTTFTISAWFKTSGAYAQEGMIANKGGIGSDTAGQNMNYGLWLTQTNAFLRGGFETGAGADNFVTSSVAVNDGIRHWAMVTYNGSELALYLDDPVTPISTLATSATPETNALDFKINENSRSASRWLTSGSEIDEVYVWNRGLTDVDERTAVFEDNIVNNTGLVIEEHFGADDLQLVAQTIADTYTAPVGIDWQEVGTAPEEPNVGKLSAGEAFPIWVWWHVDANASSRIDDPALWAFTFKIPSGGTGDPGSGGGGSGGNPTPTPTDYKIAFVGDEGCGSTTNSVISLMQSQNYDYIVSVGDHAYAGASCWTSAFTPLKSKMNSAYGNHEYSESGGITPYKTFFGHSLTYFTFQFQNIFFIVADTNISLSSGSAQHNFITNELARVASDSTITWKIAVMHNPWFGADSDHSYNDSNQIQAFHTLFQNNGVNFVVTGHNHNWQRTHQVSYNSGDPESPTVVDNTSPYSRTAVGLIHVVSGTGGHDSGSGLYALGSQPSYQAYQNRTHNGVWSIEASNNGNTLTCAFVEIGGDRFDEFTIS